MHSRTSIMTRLAISLFFISLVSAPTTLAKTIYVDADAPGTNDGTSWENAFKYLQDALADANSSLKPVEIRVAQGIYTPDSNSADPNGTGDIKATFQLINGVTLKGGYAGFGQPNPSDRDIDKYITILTGDLDGNDIDADDPCDLLTEPTLNENCYHVVTAGNTDTTAIIEGFTITAGNANHDWPDYYGGGILINPGSPIFIKCTIADNVAAQAGGLYITSGGPRLINCTFSKNAAKYAGGMLNGGSDTTLTDCIFIENFAVVSGGASIPEYATFTGCSFIRNTSGSYGGGIKNDCSAPRLDRCVFIENSTGIDGGALYNYEGTFDITDCKFVGNSADMGGAIYQGDTHTNLTGCQFIANSATTGGAIANVGYSNPILTNCTFAGNSAQDGAGFYNTTGSAPEFVNCTFYRNPAIGAGGGICTTNNYDFSPILHNCIFWANTDSTGTGQSAQINYENGTPTVNYCCIQDWLGDLGGAGNINADPCFADPNNGDYHLKSQAGRWDPNSGSWIIDDITSPCIDAGNMASHIGFEPFPNGGVINMGAYGGTSVASKSYFGKPPCEIIVAGDINGDCIVDFKDFAFIAFHWLQSYNP